ncbi:hypothetical protein V1512DRAFT_245725 [Lipomyces arxii]|uniref:uncharacterized protein n=1 Tax=Lipomyces arxii TaxID=56418 RepID=UPI0034CD75BB
MSSSSGTATPATVTTLPRKRSKVSRACDECRRKKIRCDATLDSGPEQCSSCKRVGEKCSFSRIPMKRGPSKGYIKELEDRLNSLEHSMSTDDVSTPGRRNSAISEIRTPAESFSNITNGRKASVSSTGSNNYPSDSPSSQYNSYTYSYQTANSPRALAPDQPRPRTDSIHSLPPPPSNPQLQTYQLNSPNLNNQRKRAFSSSLEYAHDSDRGIPPPLQTSFSTSPENHTERLPSIDSFKPNPNLAQLPPIQSSVGASVIDEPAPPYMAPPNGPSHYWRPPYETVKDDSRAPPLIQPPPPPPPSASSLSGPARQLQRHSIGSGMMGYDPVASAVSSILAEPYYKPSDVMMPFVWDDETVDGYYNRIHPTFPILTESRQRLRARLVATTPAIRNACLHSLYALVRGSSGPQRAEHDLKRAMHSLTDAQKDTAKLPFASSLLIVQTLVLLALETDNHGSESLDGGMRSSSYWVGSAIGLANSLKLQYPAVTSDDTDSESDARLGRRTYLVLSMLDRWNSIALSQPLQIPDYTLNLVRDDHVTLSTEPYHLVRLSLVLGHVAELGMVASGGPTGSGQLYMTNVLRGELERVRESIEETWDMKPNLELVYWHVKLAMLRMSGMGTPDPRAVLGPAVRISGLLMQRMQASTWPSPLSHHFLALVVATLLDLTEVAETRADAWRSLNLLVDVMPAATSGDGSRWSACFLRAVENRKLRGGSAAAGTSSRLERLAAVAVGESVSDAAKLGKLGYLGYLAYLVV